MGRYFGCVNFGFKNVYYYVYISIFKICIIDMIDCKFWILFVNKEYVVF